MPVGRPVPLNTDTGLWYLVRHLRGVGGDLKVMELEDGTQQARLMIPVDGVSIEPKLEKMSFT